MNFADRLRECRKRERRTQRELAEYLGVTTITYQRYELAALSPPLDKFRKLADYFDVSADYLLGRSDVRERR